MSEWAQVRWTEARQVAALQTKDASDWPEPEIAPRAHFAALRAAGKRDDAVNFLGVALPRFEAIAWGARMLDEEATRISLAGGDRQALDHALRWLGDPDDHSRRATHAASEQAGERAPERMLAMAVFFSGGSVSLPDLPAVLPPPEATGLCVSAAIIVAAHRSGDAAAMLDRALDLGEKVAEHGIRALSS